MDHLHALTEADELLVAAQNVLGGEWENADGGADTCVLPSGESGVQYGLTRGGGNPVGDAQSVAASVTAVATLWTSAGFEPTVIELPALDGLALTEVRYPETGYGVDGLYLSFQATTAGASVQALTRCVPGDAAEINRAWHEANDPAMP